LTDRARQIEPAVRLSGVTAAYGSRIALADVDLDVKAGALLAVIGPNGAGKSTLLKTIAGLLRPIAGSVEVLGGRPADHAKRIAYVPQAELVDWAFPVTVEDVVMMGRVARIGIGRGPGRLDREAVRDAIATVGLAGQVDRQIGRLSGGQRRRAFLARAIAAQPDLYLLDEPLTGVDVTTQADLMAILAAESQLGRTVIATTHDLASAARQFRQVAFINGRVVAVGPAHLATDRGLLAETYGGQVVVFDDPHHHDQEPAGERHYHQEAR
jgi:ABC-type Mn2+/Zn2+ transport system ATPase subunit